MVYSNDRVIAELLVGVLMKDFWKSVTISWSYDKNFAAHSFGAPYLGPSRLPYKEVSSDLGLHLYFTAKTNDLALGHAVAQWRKYGIWDPQSF